MNLATIIWNGMQYYRGNRVFIPQDCGDGYHRHAWLIAGFGYEGSQPFYYIKNSWGQG